MCMHPRVPAIVLAVWLATQAIPALPSAAQEPSEADRLLETIAEQQRQIETQKAQLDAQQRALEAVREEVEGLRNGSQPAPSTVAPSAPDLESTGSPATDEDEEVAAGAGEVVHPGLREALEEAAGAAETDWRGSFGLWRTDTRMKISGFVELDVIHDTDAISTPTAFVTKAIVTRGATKSQGRDGQTSFSVQASRLALETRTPVLHRRLRTFASIDFFGDFGSTSPDLRLREAYGEVTDVLLGGDLLLGQTWSTVTNLYAIPNVLDYESLNSQFGGRDPLARWTRSFGSGFQLRVAAEAPDPSFENASSNRRWPDGVVALVSQHDAWNLQGSFVGRDLNGSGANGGSDSVFGWGLSFAGRIVMPAGLKQDFATFSLTYGEGIGSLVNDAPPDASYDLTRNELEAIPTLAWFVGYQHWWNPSFYSVLSYGEVRQDTLAFQDPTAYDETRYASANLSWTPFADWLFGFETLYGSREDKDGERGSDVRFQLSSRFSF